MSSSTPVALTPPNSGQPCPCGSGKLFDECCGPLLSGEKKAATAEELMRSRFTAHVARDYGYLHRTYLTTSKQPYVDEGPTPANAWTRLTIHSHTLGATPDLAFVEFSAFYVHEDGGEAALQEKSEFRRLNGEWFYVRALRLGPAPFKSAAKVGRNDPCPCGSGKKYKHCCLNKAA